MKKSAYPIVRKVKTLEDGTQVITFTKKMLEEAGFEVGDTLLWKDLGNGSYSVTKIDPSLKIRTCVKCNEQFQSNTLKYCRECTDEKNKKNGF